MSYASSLCSCSLLFYQSIYIEIAFQIDRDLTTTSCSIFCEWIFENRAYYSVYLIFYGMKFMIPFDECIPRVYLNKKFLKTISFEVKYFFEGVLSYCK